MKKVLIFLLLITSILSTGFLFYYKDKSENILKEKDNVTKRIEELKAQQKNTEKEITEKDNEYITLSKETEEKMELYKSWEELNKEIQDKLQ